MGENEVKDFDDIVEALEAERESAAPRYISLPESIFGEMQRISKEKVQQINKMQGGEAWN